MISPVTSSRLVPRLRSSVSVNRWRPACNNVPSRAPIRQNAATMSHSVTIRTQTVTSGSTAIFIHSGYLKTWSGIVKLLQLALGIVCVGIMGNEFSYSYYQETANVFFLLMTTTFLIGTFILLLGCLLSLSTASIISKTIYELLYHAIAFGLLLAASLTLLVHVNNYNNRRTRHYELLLGASICGLVNTALYLFSTILSIRTYRGI